MCVVLLCNRDYVKEQSFVREGALNEWVAFVGKALAVQEEN